MCFTRSKFCDTRKLKKKLNLKTSILKLVELGLGTLVSTISALEWKSEYIYLKIDYGATHWEQPFSCFFDGQLHNCFIPDNRSHIHKSIKLKNYLWLDNTKKNSRIGYRKNHSHKLNVFIIYASHYSSEVIRV